MLLSRRVGSVKRWLNQVPLRAERLLDSKESNSRPLEAAGFRVMSSDHPPTGSSRFNSLCGPTSAEHC